MDRFIVAKDRKHIDLCGDEHKVWHGPFFFIQFADTQLGLLNGMLKKDKRDWKRFVRVRSFASAGLVM